MMFHSGLPESFSQLIFQLVLVSGCLLICLHTCSHYNTTTLLLLEVKHEISVQFVTFYITYILLYIDFFNDLIIYVLVKLVRLSLVFTKGNLT